MVNNVNATGWGFGMGLGLVASLVGPFMLWPVEQVLPWPVWVEEGYKLWLVWSVLRAKPQKPIFWVILVGLGFGLSETMLYLLNFIQSGDLTNWGLRLVTTVPMHAITSLILYGGWAMGGGPLGIIPAGLVHQWFNSNI